MAALVVFTQWLIGVTFILSAVSKVGGAASLRMFADSLVQLGLARRGRQAVAGAVAVGVTEALVAVVLLPAGGVPVRLGFGLALVLLVAFSVVIARSLARGDGAACRCFGGAKPAPFSRVHLVRNAVLLLAAGAGAALAGQLPAQWQLWLIMAPAGAICAFVVSRLDDVVGLFKAA